MSMSDTGLEKSARVVFSKCQPVLSMLLSHPGLLEAQVPLHLEARLQVPRWLKPCKY